MGEQQGSGLQCETCSCSGGLFAKGAGGRMWGHDAGWRSQGKALDAPGTRRSLVTSPWPSLGYSRVSDTKLLYSRKLLLNHCRGRESERVKRQEFDFQGHRLKQHFPNQTLCVCVSPQCRLNQEHATLYPRSPQARSQLHFHVGLGAEGGGKKGPTFTG